MSVETEQGGAGERPEQAEAAEVAAEAEAEAAAAAEQSPAERVAALERERDELYARLQRVSADFENYQQRTKREKAKWSHEAVRGLLDGLLPALDSLDYAVAAFDRDVKDPAALRQGVELCRDTFQRVLSGEGLTVLHVEPGHLYDSDKHLAIGIHETEEVDDETVAYVARPGYMLGDVVLRPAQVGVNKPKPKALPGDGEE